MNKAFFRWAGKALGAGLAAFLLLCLFCCFYYNVPVHFANPDGATEYKWEPGRFYSRGTEGFALGRINSDGFNNLRDYSPGERIDILLMGSSHMEGFNLAQDENAAAVLNTLFAGQRRVYNIGTAGHTFLYCVKHLERALDVYAPAQYVLIEAADLSFPAAEIEAAVDGTLPDIPSHTGGLLTALQKLPFLRLFYTKYVKTGEAFGDPEAQPTAAESSDADYERAMDRLLGKVARVSAEHRVVPIVVYDPGVLPDADGRGYTAAKPGQRELFRRLCEKNGVALIDLTERYLHALDVERVFPFGFSNTEPGAGHMNRRGHRMFAEAVFRFIEEREG